MTEDDKKKLKQDPDGLLSYEYLANHIGECTPEDIDYIVDNMISVDLNGQLLASAARYLHSIDAQGFDTVIRRMVGATIDKDREHRYLPDLMAGLYGADYMEHAKEMCLSDDNFRRIYKRLYPAVDSL